MRLPAGAGCAADRDALLARARAQSVWYHTIELGPEYTTPGLVDLRSVAPRVLKSPLANLRALDVGTYDGFWAFELEARGAREVLAADLAAYDERSWPPRTRRELAGYFGDSKPGDRFRIAHALRGSRVAHVESSIYDLNVERLGGPVDFALIGALLLHLRDPVGGLEAVHSVLEPGGRLLIVEPVDLALSIMAPRRACGRLRAGVTQFDWWVGNRACLRGFLTIAGFEAIQQRALFRLNSIKNMRQWHLALECRRR